MAFDILQHIDKLQPDGGSISAAGDHSFHCPVCGSSNFKVNVTTGKWATFGCDCGNTPDGKRKIRDALSPAAKPEQPEIVPYGQGNGIPIVQSIKVSTKAPRPKAERHWDYFTADSDSPAITVNRLDDPDQPDGDGWKGGRKINQTQHLGKGSISYAEVAAKVQPYRLKEALQALADGAPYIYFVEGEPCADAMWRIGLPAITNLGGSNGFKPDRDGPQVSGIPADRLVVCPDRDQLGLKHAAKVAAAYSGCRWLYCYGPQAPEWNGSCPPDGGLDLFDWIQDGATVEQIISTIQDSPLPVAEPKGEAQGKLVSDFLSDARNATAQLKAGLDRINALDDDDVRPLAYIALRRELGLQPKEFDRLLLGFIQGERGCMEGSDLKKISQKTEVIIQDLLSSGLSVLCGDSHAGKTYAAYQLVEAVAQGKKFAGAFQATKGNCIIVQMDEPFPMVKKNWKVMGIEFDSGEVNVYDHWNYFQLHRLKQWVKRHNAKLVILDSLKHIAGGEYEPKDSSISLMLYELDRFAMESGIAIVLLHHIVKPERAQPGKKSTPNEYFELFKEHMFGSTYLSASCTDVWMYWKFMPEGKNEPSYAMKAARCRSNIVDLDTIYEFAGSIDDCRLHHTGIRGQVSTYDELSSAVDRVLSFIRAQNGRSFTAKEICDRLRKL